MVKEVGSIGIPITLLNDAQVCAARPGRVGCLDGTDKLLGTYLHAGVDKWTSFPWKAD